MINNIELLKQDLIRIENIKTWLIDIPQIHPDSDKYLKIWSKYTRFCIEGLWGYDNGGWRYMPGTLFFYGNFFTFLDVDEEQNIRRKGKPTIRDIDWMLHYAYLEAQGFSGWENDDEYTSDRAALEPDEFKRLKHSKKVAEQKRFLCMINDNGEPKRYLSARDNIKKLHDRQKGKPLYWNHAKNLQVFGSRGGR